MATMIKQTDVMQALENLSGYRTSPGGTSEDFKRYIQASFNYCWRYYKWNFSLKTADVAIDGLLPTDMDFEGYREFSGVTEVDLIDTLGTTSAGSAVVWDADLKRYKLSPAVEATIVYQYEPPLIGSDPDIEAPFPDAMAVAIGCTVFSKKGANPTRADVQQEWDEFHAFLDRLTGKAEKSRPHSPRNYHDKTGSFTGYVGS